MQDLRTEVQQFCRATGLRLNKELGQHYLINQNVLNAIIESAQITTTDTIVEIGPGIGILTRELIKKAKQVIAIEVDERVIPLCRLFTEQVGASTAKLDLIVGNALQVPLPAEPYKIVANIPYHITSPLLRRCFYETTIVPTSLTLLIQKEVAIKICDQTETSVLAIMVRLFGEPTIVCHVPPKDFFPPPKVDSSVIHIASFAEPLVSAAIAEEIFKLAKHAFSQKRKMIRNTIGSLPGGAELLAAANIAETRRPQAITVPEWITLATLRSKVERT